MKEEQVDIVDENDNVVATVTRKEMIGERLLHRGTIVLVLNSKGEVFITKRARTKDTAPGLYEIGQGGVVASGESYEENAKRELSEELGISDMKLLFLFDFHFEGKNIRYLAKVFSCRHDGRMELQEEEIEDGFFISIKKLREMLAKNPEDFTRDSIPLMERYLEYLASAQYTKV